jgi:septum formation protein
MSLLEGKKLILASASPRRKELLKGLDIPFETRVYDVAENYPEELTPEHIPAFLARLKAEAFKNKLAENEVAITSDTIVVLNDKLLVKPKDKTEAFKMIQKLSGKMHKVLTAVCVTSVEKQVCFTDESKVYLKNLEKEEIEYYIEKYHPYDKAGGYGIQDWIGYIAINKIEGSYYTIMGLPTHRLYDVLKEF